MTRLGEATLLLLLASSGATAGTTVTTVPVGRLTVARELYVHEGTPVLHSVSTWKKNRLEWASQDGRVRFFLEDGGGELNANYEVLQPQRPKFGCGGHGFPQAYQSHMSPKRRWLTTLRGQLVDFLKDCEAWVGTTQRRAYAAEFRNAADDFGPALELLKRAAVEDFGDWQRRCLKWKIDRNYSPFPRTRCVRHSARAN